MDSKTIFELRKESQNLSGIEKLNKLNDALVLVRNLYSEYRTGKHVTNIPCDVGV